VLVVAFALPVDVTEKEGNEAGQGRAPRGGEFEDPREGQDRDRLQGFEVGADDYLPKPFEPRELLLRLGNMLRRTAAATAKAVEPADAVQFGEFIFRIERGELRKGGELVRLTDRERELLQILAKNRGEAVPRDEIAGDEELGERTVDVQINRLRRKIETDPSNPMHLQTVRGFGYRLLVD
jgi:two-component system phosphate regulon response regulator OmpR